MLKQGGREGGVQRSFPRMRETRGQNTVGKEAFGEELSLPANTRHTRHKAQRARNSAGEQRSGQAARSTTPYGIVDRLVERVNEPTDLQ